MSPGVVSVIFLSLTLLPVAVLSYCIIKIPNDLPVDNEPVYLTMDNQLVRVNSLYQMVWSAGQISKVLCSGSGNSLEFDNQTLLTIECIKGKQFSVAGMTRNFSDIRCKKLIKGDVRLDTKKRCGSGNSLFNVGFQSGPTFIPYFESCYRKSGSGSARYTKHVLQGDVIPNGCLAEPRPELKYDGTPMEVKGLHKYAEWTRQRERFKKQSSVLAERFTQENHLIFGQLTPFCDALFAPLKHATRLFLNSAPQWTMARNWREVETMARYKARRMKRALEIYTGTYQVLKLDDADLRLMENNFVRVPKWFWKIIRDPSSKRGIALVTLNNIFAEDVEQLCPSICSSSRWNKTEFSDYRKGFTYCCDVNELMKVVPDIPSDAATEFVLNYK